MFYHGTVCVKGVTTVVGRGTIVRRRSTTSDVEEADVECQEFSRRRSEARNHQPGGRKTGRDYQHDTH